MSKAEFLNIIAVIISTGGFLNALAAGLRYFHARKVGRAITPAVILMTFSLACIYGSIAIVQIR